MPLSGSGLSHNGINIQVAFKFSAVIFKDKYESIILLPYNTYIYIELQIIMSSNGIKV